MTLLLLACADPPDPSLRTVQPLAEAPATAPSTAAPESDRPYARTGAWALAGHTVELRDATIYADGLPVLTHVYDDPVAGPATLYVPADPGEGDGGIYVVAVGDGLVLANPLVTVGRPERLALAPDASTIAFVSGQSGLASLWVLPTAGGQPRQLTNRDLRAQGAAPVGFVPPPDRAPPRFEGDRLVWEARGARRDVAWK